MENTIAVAGRTRWEDRALAVDSTRRYVITVAESPEEVRLAQRLRFEVFNMELAEGLVSSFVTGRDEDPFDEVCDHLVVRELATGDVVGTYRYQTGLNALAKRGYYSELEFDLAPFEPLRSQVLELGRACVHKDHRNLRVLATLWRGIAAIVVCHRVRYLIGCSSLNSTHGGEGVALYRQLATRHLAPLELRTRPWPHAVCPTTAPLPPAPRVPKLLAAYLSLGAWIASTPAIDHEFGTIDFLTVLDLQHLNAEAARLYLGSQWQAPSVGWAG
jgi:putative hemolysin